MNRIITAEMGGEQFESKSGMRIIVAKRRQAGCCHGHQVSGRSEVTVGRAAKWSHQRRECVQTTVMGGSRAKAKC